MFRLFSILLLFLLLPSKAATIPLADLLDQRVRTYLPQAQTGVIILEADSGRLLHQVNADQYFSPASNIKLFTAAASLVALGPDYRFKTSVHWPNKPSPSPVTIVFRGDPSLSVTHLQRLIAQLPKQGISDIILDTTIFSGNDIAPGIAVDDLPWYYAAPSSAIVLNNNAFGYDLTTSKQFGKAVTLRPRSPYAPKIIHNNLLTVTQRRASLCPEAINITPQNQLILNGCWPASDKSQFIRLAVANPVLLAKQVITDQLKQSNIKISGTIKLGTLDKNHPAQLTQTSPPLKQLIKNLLTYSDNITANNLTRLLGHKIYKHGTFSAGAKAIEKIIREYADINNLQLAEGAGTRYNLVTPRQISQLLFALWQDENLKPLFLKALPIAGKNGTLKTRMTSQFMANKILAKTGSMQDTAALSGYLLTDKPLIFTLISNHVYQDTANARDLEQQLLSLIIKNPEEAL